MTRTFEDKERAKGETRRVVVVVVIGEGWTFLRVERVLAPYRQLPVEWNIKYTRETGLI